jgi:hypothetical protein
VGCEWEGRRESRTGTIIVSFYLGSGGDRCLGSCNDGPAAGARVHRERSMPRRPRKRNVSDQQHQRLVFATFGVRFASLSSSEAGHESADGHAEVGKKPTRRRDASASGANFRRIRGLHLTLPYLTLPSEGTNVAAVGCTDCALASLPWIHLEDTYLGALYTCGLVRYVLPPRAVYNIVTLQRCNCSCDRESL